MPDCASNLLHLLESDLLSHGWDPQNTGPKSIQQQRFDFVCESLRKSLLKKYIPRGETKETRKLRRTKALDIFISDNEICRDWTLPRDDELDVVLGEVKTSLDMFFHPANGRDILLTPHSVLSGIDVGKGANIGCLNVDFYSKVCASQVTYSSDGLRHFLAHAFSPSSPWAGALYQRPPGMSPRKVVGSKIAFAEKNAEVDRTICEEPTMEMLLQKGTEACMNFRLAQVFNIWLDTQQEINADLARIGSIDESFATLDLRSASNRNSVKMMSHVLPPDVTSWLMKIRTKFAVLPNGDAVELHMLSSMGNAYTFPLQTILFACVIQAVYYCLGIPFKTGRRGESRNFAVNGDDIICVTRAFPLVCKVLSALGHEVNLEKTFYEGRFRESCGSDFWSGYNVRGVYIKSLKTPCDIYSSINRLNQWSTRHGIPLVRSITFLIDMLKPHQRLVVPMHEDDTSGIRAPQQFAKRSFYKRERGKSYFARVTKLRSVVLSSESALLKKKTFIQNELKESGESSEWYPFRKYWSKIWYNPDGHLLTALSGRLRDCSFELRQFSRRTVKRRRYSPCWDYIGAEARESGLRTDDYLYQCSINLVTLMRS